MGQHKNSIAQTKMKLFKQLPEELQQQFLKSMTYRLRTMWDMTSKGSSAKELAESFKITRSRVYKLLKEVAEALELFVNDSGSTKDELNSSS